MAGISIISATSLFNANFTLPMKYTKKWEWEHAWGMWAFCQNPLFSNFYAKKLIINFWL